VEFQALRFACDIAAHSNTGSLQVGALLLAIPLAVLSARPPLFEKKPRASSPVAFHRSILGLEFCKKTCRCSIGQQLDLEFGTRLRELHRGRPGAAAAGGGGPEAVRLDRRPRSWPLPRQDPHRKWFRAGRTEDRGQRAVLSFFLGANPGAIYHCRIRASLLAPAVRFHGVVAPGIQRQQQPKHR
jgi:hypothetical protein